MSHPAYQEPLVDKIVGRTVGGIYLVVIAVPVAAAAVVGGAIGFLMSNSRLSAWAVNYVHRGQPYYYPDPAIDPLLRPEQKLV